MNVVRCLLVCVGAALSVSVAAGANVLDLEWDELLPADARAGYDAAPPPPIHDYLSGGESGLAALQPMSFEVNPELDGLDVRLPGFIVPLELDADGKVTEFFLVPYFGACIHVPPPPPNQLVYVTIERGLVLDSMYAAYWVTGRMSIAQRTTRLGASAYVLDAREIEEYEY
jgi:hypothetical protein